MSKNEYYYDCKFCQTRRMVVKRSKPRKAPICPVNPRHGPLIFHSEKPHNVIKGR